MKPTRQVTIRCGPGLLDQIDDLRGELSVGAWVKQSVEMRVAREWPITLDDGPVRGPEPHQVIVDEVDPFPDHDSETRALVGDPANPYLLP